MTEMPESVARCADQLRGRGFVEVDAQTGPMNSGVIAFRRDPVALRTVKDRGQWSVDLTAPDWPEAAWESFPLFQGFALNA